MLARTLILAASSWLLAGCGITGNFRHDLGYADFGPLQHLSADSHVGLSLGPVPLKIAAWGINLAEDEDEDDEELGSFLRELRAVRVYTFEGVEEDPADVERGVKDLTAELARDGWLNIAAVREESELTSVFLRPDKNFAHRGLVVIVQEPDEVVLVNLIGNIRLDFIDGYLADLDVHVPPIEIDPAALETLQASVASRPAGPAAEIDP
jgi:uncharacterized protein DUF4252